MSFDFDTSEDVGGGGGFVSEPGTYHVAIRQILEGQGKKGSPIDGFTIEAEVLAGTVEGCGGASWSESLFAPNGKSEKGDEWAKKKITAFFIAVDLMKPSDLGSHVSVDLQQAIGRQFLVQLDKEMELNAQTGKYDIPGKYLQISFANLYHVDDPAVKSIPKNQDALGLIPKELRHEAAYFEPLKKKGGKSAGKSQPPASDQNFDDLFE